MKKGGILSHRSSVMRRLIKVVLAVTLVAVLFGSCASCGTSRPLVVRGYVSQPTRDAVVVRFDGEVTPYWLASVETAAKNPNTRLVILWIDSPGGYVSDTKLLAHGLAVIKAKYNKQIWVYSEYVLASGAYWAACEADSIFVSPVAVVGSIGVYSVRVDVSAQDSMAGIKYWYFASHENKVKGSIHLPITEQERIAYMLSIRPIYVQFVSQVLNGRFEQLRKRSFFSGAGGDTASVVQYTVNLADGSVYGGVSSYNLGLSDGVFYFDEFCDYLRKLGFTVKKSNGHTIGTFWDS